MTPASAPQRGQYAEAEEPTARRLDSNRESATLGLARYSTPPGEPPTRAKPSTRRSAALADAPAKPASKSSPALLASAAEQAFDQGDAPVAARRVDETLKLALPTTSRALGESTLAARRRLNLDEATKACEWFIQHYNATDKITSPEDLPLYRFGGGRVLAAGRGSRSAQLPRQRSGRQRAEAEQELLGSLLRCRDSSSSKITTSPMLKNHSPLARAINPQAAVVYAAAPPN